MIISVGVSLRSVTHRSSNNIDRQDKRKQQQQHQQQKQKQRKKQKKQTDNSSTE